MSPLRFRPLRALPLVLSPALAVGLVWGCSSSPSGEGQATDEDASVRDGSKTNADASKTGHDASKTSHDAAGTGHLDARGKDSARGHDGAGDHATADVSEERSSETDAGSPDEGPPDEGPPGDAGPKTPITGLIDMQTITWHNTATGEPTFNIGNVDMFPGLLGGIVINATWNVIQPSQSDAATDLDFKAIDAALVAIGAYNKA